MFRLAYVNGQYTRHADSLVHVEDRGFQFADGVYEVIAIRHGVPVDMAAHLRRLEYSLGELSIPMPMAPKALVMVMRRVVRENRVGDGIVYLQISRGVAPRAHPFPRPAPPPSLVITARPLPPTPTAVLEKGVSVVTTPDIRWLRRDIKSVALLPNCLAKEKAAQAGAFECWQLEDDGTISEAAAANVWIVDQAGRAITRPLSNRILAGITRLKLLELARHEGIEVEERTFTLKEALAAREAFVSGTTAFAMPVVKVDEAVIGDGRPGAVTRRLRELYEGMIGQLTEAAWWQ